MKMTDYFEPPDGCLTFYGMIISRNPATVNVVIMTFLKTNYVASATGD